MFSDWCETMALFSPTSLWINPVWRFFISGKGWIHNFQSLVTPKRMSHTIWLNGFCSSRDEIIPCKRLKWRNTLTRNFFNLSMTRKNSKSGRTKFRSKSPTLTFPRKNGFRNFLNAPNSSADDFFTIVQERRPLAVIGKSDLASLSSGIAQVGFPIEFPREFSSLIGRAFPETNSKLSAQFERYKCFCCWKMLLFETEKRRLQNE